MTLHDHGHSHGHHGHSHGEHGHSHSSDDGRDTPKSGHSGFSLTSIADSTKSADINIRAAMVHVIGDLLQVKTAFKSLNEFTEGLEFSGQNEPEELSGEFQPPCTFELVILCLSITWRNFYRVEISAESVLPCTVSFYFKAHPF